jgi:hypothetical protein
MTFDTALVENISIIEFDRAENEFQFFRETQTNSTFFRMNKQYKYYREKNCQ